jgi:plasmid stability protein
MDRLRDPQAVWDIFREDETVLDMERLTALKRPAVGATSAKLLALGNWVRGDDAKRTFGKLARCVMETRGYTVERPGVPTPGDPLFTKGTRYHLRRPASSEPTSTLMIGNIDPQALACLRVSAARNRRSIEAEAAQILTDALLREKQSAETNLAEAIHRRFADVGGADDLEPHPPTPIGEPPQFEP